jgi:hypothetical protein
MAARAANTGLAVVRAQKVRMSTRMAAEASRIDLLRGHLAQLQNLGRISTGCDVGLPRPVATLTGDAFAAMHQRQFRMRIRGELLGNDPRGTEHKSRSRQTLSLTRRLFEPCLPEDEGARDELGRDRSADKTGRAMCRWMRATDAESTSTKRQ